MDTNRISIIIPVYNEVENLDNCFQLLKSHCVGDNFEFIFVDDGSTDNSRKEIQKICQLDKRVSLIPFKRNFGQTAALAAGINHSKGHIIVLMDADGQNDPSDIHGLLEKISSGYDVVSGWRKDRKDPFFSRILPSLIANKIISFVTGVRLHDYGCTLKAYRREILKDVQLFGDMHRFLPAWCVWQGGKVAEIEVKHHPRIHGRSKYGLFRTFKVIVDLITLKFFSGYLARPGHLFSGTGLIFLLLGFLSAGYAIFDKFGPDNHEKLRIPLLLLAVFFGLGAIFLVLMGLLAELLVRLYFQVQNQKPYKLDNE